MMVQQVCSHLWYRVCPCGRLQSWRRVVGVSRKAIFVVASARGVSETEMAGYWNRSRVYSKLEYLHVLNSRGVVRMNDQQELRWRPRELEHSRGLNWRPPKGSDRVCSRAYLPSYFYLRPRMDLFPDHGIAELSRGLSLKLARVAGSRCGLVLLVPEPI
jgi:hypothetical protein